MTLETSRFPRTPDHVARLATKANIFSATDPQLIGLYGDPSVRRALLLMPSGRPVKVSQGDETDAGEVIEIGEDFIVLRRLGRETTLTMPPLM